MTFGPSRPMSTMNSPSSRSDSLRCRRRRRSPPRRSRRGRSRRRRAGGSTRRSRSSSCLGGAGPSARPTPACPAAREATSTPRKLVSPRTGEDGRFAGEQPGAVGPAGDLAVARQPLERGGGGGPADADQMSEQLVGERDGHVDAVASEKRPPRTIFPGLGPPPAPGRPSDAMGTRAVSDLTTAVRPRTARGRPRRAAGSASPDPLPEPRSG